MTVKRANGHESGTLTPRVGLARLAAVASSAAACGSSSRETAPSASESDSHVERGRYLVERHREDGGALVAYLRSLPPNVDHAVVRWEPALRDASSESGRKRIAS